MEDVVLAVDAEGEVVAEAVVAEVAVAEVAVVEVVAVDDLSNGPSQENADQ